jgi:hypothetical protein
LVKEVLMFPALALALILAASPHSSSPYASSVKGDQVTIRFTELDKIYGPFKIYASADGFPNATACATCPEGACAAACTVDPSMIYQKWQPGGRYVDVSFPLSCVNNMQVFYFTAVTCVPGDERFVTTGVVPFSSR